jgi:hypothetical protein
MSRPTMGVDHVEALPGEREAKERLKAILGTLGGAVRVEDACERLTLSPSRFHEIREEALSAALSALSPKPPGRPKGVPAEAAEVTALKEENARLRREVEVARIRTEIALVMPHLVKPPLGEEKGGSTRQTATRPST